MGTESSPQRFIRHPWCHLQLESKYSFRIFLSLSVEDIIEGRRDVLKDERIGRYQKKFMGDCLA